MTSSKNSENVIDKNSHEYLMERIYKQIENAYGGFEQYFVIN